MDVEIPQTSNPHLQYFKLDEANFLWQPETVSAIRARREELDGELFFDHLLSIGGIQEPSMVYPPADADSLNELLEAIEDTAFDRLKKDCLIYYLLDAQDPQVTGSFKESRCIPQQFIALSEAFWQLDEGGDFDEAISLLSDTRIKLELTSKIIDTLSKQSEGSRLVLSFVRTCQPVLQEFDDMRLYALALVDLDIMEAWSYQRSFAEQNVHKRELLTTILAGCFMPSPRPNALRKLISIPFTTYEQEVAEEISLREDSGLEPTSLSSFQDFLITRLISGAKYAAAFNLERQYERMKNVAKSPIKRREILDSVLSTLSQAQRAVLEVELGEPLPVGTGSLSGFSRASANVPSDMDGSWVNVNGTTPNGDKAQSNASRQAKFTGRMEGAPSPARYAYIAAADSPASAKGSLQDRTGGTPAKTRTFGTPIRTTQENRGPMPSSSSAFNFMDRKAGSLMSGASGSGQRPVQRPVQPAGSASDQPRSAFQTKNAFYTPPAHQSSVPLFSGSSYTPSTNVRTPAKDPVAPLTQQDTFHTVSTTPRSPIRNRRDDAEDFAMESDDDLEIIRGLRPELNGGRSEDEIELDVSRDQEDTVSAKSTSPIAQPVRLQRMESEGLLPPGAFPLTQSERGNPQRDNAQTKVPETIQEEPEEHEEEESRRTTRGHNLRSRKRVSVPGSLATDEEDEESDRVGDLPSRPSRRARQTSVEPEGNAPRRRSSRLSAASVSPESVSGSTKTRASARKGPSSSVKPKSKRSKR